MEALGFAHKDVFSRLSAGGDLKNIL